MNQTFIQNKLIQLVHFVFEQSRSKWDKWFARYAHQNVQEWSNVCSLQNVEPKRKIKKGI